VKEVRHPDAVDGLPVGGGRAVDVIAAAGSGRPNRAMGCRTFRCRDRSCRCTVPAANRPERNREIKLGAGLHEVEVPSKGPARLSTTAVQPPVRSKAARVSGEATSTSIATVMLTQRIRRMVGSSYALVVAEPSAAVSRASRRITTPPDLQRPPIHRPPRLARALRDLRRQLADAPAGRERLARMSSSSVGAPPSPRPPPPPRARPPRRAPARRSRSGTDLAEPPAYDLLEALRQLAAHDRLPVPEDFRGVGQERVEAGAAS
jgi:hypothetical protein